MPISFKIITLFPELIRGYLADALIAKALGQDLMRVELIPLRDFSDNAYRSVDDAPFGGGDGMLIRPDILEKALLAAKDPARRQHVIYFTPQGKPLSNARVTSLASAGRGEAGEAPEFILICGRYAGVDQRFIDLYVDEEISAGDYVLSGGELPALVLLEAVSRFVPGVLGKLESAHHDSLREGPEGQLLEAPQYTRPREWNGRSVPEILLSGDHRRIGEWKRETALAVTEEKRPDLLKRRSP